NLGTTNRQSLTLGGGTTGNIIIANNTIQTGATNFTTGTGLTTIGGNLTVNGTALTITNAATLDLANSQTSALNIEGGLLNFDTANSRIGIKTTTPTADLDVAGTASVAGSLTFRNGTGLIQTTQNNPLTIGGSTTGDVIISGRNASQDGIIFQNYGLGLIHSDASGRLTSSLVNLETDVLGILPSANGGSPFDAANGAIFERNTTQDFLLGGQSTASAKFAVLNVNAGTPVASLSGGAFFTGAGNFSTINNQTLTLGGVSTGNIVIDSGSSLISLVDATTLSGNFTQTGVTSFTTGTGLTTVGGTLQINGNNLTFNNANSTVTLGSSVTALNIAGGLVDLDTTGGGRVAIGTIPPLEKFDVNGNATVSGNLTLYGGARSIQSTSGNALTIGGSSTGNVIIAAQGGIGGTGVVFQGYGTGLIHSDANGILTSSLVNLTTDVSGILPVANGGSPFDQANGSIFERNTSQDFLLGGQSTSSAKFAVLNVNAGTPVASLSGGTFLTGGGNLGTTNNQTLTLGGTTTGTI